MSKNNIDTKLLLWIIVFVISIFILSFNWIIPVTNKYISAKNNLDSINKNLKNIENNYYRLNNEIEKLISDNNENLDKFKNEFDIKELHKYCLSFFENVEIKQTNINKDYISYQINVSTKIKTPSIFYKFIERLNEFNHIIKIHFPIIMKADENMIKAQFNILVYKI